MHYRILTRVKKVFENTYNYLSEHLIPNNLVIYLKCGIDCLQSRIRRRDRDMESTISRVYLQQHIEILEKVENILVIDSEKYDFRGPDSEEVLKLIEGTGIVK